MTRACSRQTIAGAATVWLAIAPQLQGVDAPLGTVSIGKLADRLVVDGPPLRDITVLQRGIVHIIKDGVQYK